MNSSLILVGIALFTWGIGEGMFLYFVPIHLQNLGANPITIGSVISAFGLMMMVTHIPAGYLSDRLGRRPLLRTAWLVGMSAAWVMALAPSLPMFVTGYLLYGLTAFVSSPLFSYVTAARGKLTAGRAMTLTSAAFNLGAVIGPMVGGWIGELFSLRVIFTVASSIFVVSTVMVFFLRPQPLDEQAGASANKNLLANKRFFGFLGVSFFAVFAMFLAQPLTPNFLQGERGISLGQLGLLGSIASLGNAFMNLTLGQLSPRLGFVLGQACVGLFALLMWKGNSALWYGMGYFLMGGFRAGRMLVMAQVKSLVRESQMGLAYGITEAASSAAMIVAPLLAGFLYDREPVSVYPIGLLLIAAGLLVTLFFAPRGQAQTSEPVIGIDHA